MGRVGYVSTKHTNNRKRAHVDRGCARLVNATSVKEVDLDEDEPYCHWGVCGFCSGSWTPSEADNSLSRLLGSEDFGPEDVGLSPVGARGDVRE